MNTVCFTITKGKTVKEYNLDVSNTIKGLKKKIMCDFNTSSNYIDIDFQLERPIRTLGKFNLEPGILPRTLDMYSFDRFGIEGKTINASFNEITDYESPRARKKELTLTKKEGKVDRGEGSIPFNLNSDDDFPALSL